LRNCQLIFMDFGFPRTNYQDGDYIEAVRNANGKIVFVKNAEQIA
jgi:hypothetical protein